MINALCKQMQTLFKKHGNNVKRGNTDVKSFSGSNKINSITFTMLL